MSEDSTDEAITGGVEYVRQRLLESLNSYGVAVEKGGRGCREALDEIATLQTQFEYIARDCIRNYIAVRLGSRVAAIIAFVLGLAIGLIA